MPCARRSPASGEASPLLLPSRAVKPTLGGALGETVVQDLLSLGGPDPPLLLVLLDLLAPARRRADRDAGERVLRGRGARRHRRGDGQGQHPDREAEEPTGLPHRLSARYAAARQDAPEGREPLLREGG